MSVYSIISATFIYTDTVSIYMLKYSMSGNEKIKFNDKGVCDCNLFIEILKSSNFTFSMNISCSFIVYIWEQSGISKYCTVLKSVMT